MFTLTGCLELTFFDEVSLEFITYCLICVNGFSDFFLRNTFSFVTLEYLVKDR